jgi:hypothetical protein
MVYKIDRKSYTFKNIIHMIILWNTICKYTASIYLKNQNISELHVWIVLKFPKRSEKTFNRVKIKSL